MKINAPHFLLFSTGQAGPPGEGGRWHFLLESLQDGTRLEAGDHEPDASGERLELLALVRGLEALDQPSRVTLVTGSRQIERALRSRLEVWRANGWRWECYGRWVRIKHADLWQRIDRALAFHQVQCRTVRFDGAHTDADTAPVHSEGWLRRTWSLLCRRGGRLAPLRAPALGPQRWWGHASV